MATSLKAAVPTTARACGAVHALRRADASNAVDEQVTPDVAEELISRARAGKLVSLELDATVYVQSSTPNRNLVRFREGALQSLARSFENVPFMRDHAQDNTLARGGLVVSSKLLRDESDAGRVSSIRQTIRLSEPWAVEAALRGSIDRFSIGWHSVGDLSCSICGELVSWWLTCDHELGEIYDGQTCQIEFSDAEGVEVSAVSVPAVVGTELEGIRAALARSRGVTPQESTMNPKLCTLLGLAAAATEDQIVAAIEGLKLKGEADAEQLAITASALKETRARLTTIEEQSLTEGVEREIARGISEGRLAIKRDKDGKRVESAIERSLRHAAKVGGLAGVKELIDGFAPGVASPVNVAPRSLTPDPTPAGSSVTLSPKEIAAARSLGIPLDEYAKHKTQLVEEAAVQQEERR